MKRTVQNSGVNVQQTALNGAQVASLLEVVNRVASGLLPRDAAVEIIVNAFNITAEEADSMLGTVGRGFKPAEILPPKTSGFGPNN